MFHFLVKAGKKNKLQRRNQADLVVLYSLCNYLKIGLNAQFVSK